jgi:hypothetical protein
LIFDFISDFRFPIQISMSFLIFLYLDKELLRTDAPIKFVMNLSSPGVPDTARLTQQDRDQLVELLIEKDESLHTIYRNFYQQPELFKYYALRFLQRRAALPKKPTPPPTPPS